MTDKETRPKKKTALAVTFAALGIIAIAAAAVYIYKAGRLDRLCDISSRPLENDHVYMHESGSYSGNLSIDTNVYREGSKYFLEYDEHTKNKEPVRVELTKAEFLLCTDIDTEFLREAYESVATDLVYWDITVGRLDGEEEKLPRKAYTFVVNTLHRFIAGIAQTPPVGRFSRERYIKLISYLNVCGSDTAFLRYVPSPQEAEKVTGFYHGFYQFIIQKENVNVPRVVFDGVKKRFGLLLTDDLTEKEKQQKEKYIAEFTQTEYFGETAYCRAGEENGVFYALIASPAYQDKLVFYCVKPEGAPESFADDLLSILTGAD